MSPEQVYGIWHWLEPLFKQGLAPQFHDENCMAEFLRSILLEKVQVWSIADGEQIVGYTVTEVKQESITGVRYLYISLLVAEGMDNVDMWVELVATLKKFARGKACSALRAYTAVPSIVELTEMLGGTSNQKLIELGVI